MTARGRAANRSLVGIMSFIAARNVDFIVSGSPAACTFAQTRGHGSSVNFRVIRNVMPRA